MKLFNQISVLLLAFIFFLSASGIVIFRSHCNCTGKEHVSLFVHPETCEENFHYHHIHKNNGEEVPSSADDCHECENHMDECGCNNLNLNYYKLKDEMFSQNARTIILLPFSLVKYEHLVILLSDINDESQKTFFHYIEPPSNKRSVDFLISISQLKIPRIA
ncbi:MAG: hypothetical protein PHH93_07590 [Prolixibacteraceae bacterium]|nr:hypothetical protein [Prolixibacteraceae bacterium]